MLRRIMITISGLAAVAVFASSASADQGDTSAETGGLYVVDSEFNRSRLPVPQPECTAIRDVASPPIVGPVLAILNHSTDHAEFFFADGCTGDSFVVPPNHSEGHVGLDPTHYLTW